MILAEPRRDRRQRLGELGEDAAAAELARRGMRVLERRWRSRHGEIDLIAELDDGLLVFVEVKARRALGFGTPSEAVTPLKRRRIARVALAYLARNDWLERPCRFDVVEVLTSGVRVRAVRHVEDAFRLWPTG